MRVKKRLVIAILIVMICLPLMVACQNVYAASYPIPSVSKSQLTDHTGEDVTGDDIVNTASYLAGLSHFTYDNVGTCTGFVTRVLMHLRVGLPLVSRNSNWNYCYEEDLWDQPGYIYTAAWGPSGFKTQADKMVESGEAQYITMISFDKQSDADYVSSLGIQNGDLLITPEENGKSGHVAFAYIYNGQVKSLGAGNGIGATDLKSSMSNKQGDIYVYRLVEAQGNLKVLKIDEYNKPVAGVTFHISGPSVDQDYVTDGNGEIVINDITPGEYTVVEIAVPYGMILDSTPMTKEVVAGDTVTVKKENHYQTGKARLHKQDIDNGSTPKGDATFGGAVYNLRADEEIKQGETHRYDKDEVIKQVVLGIDGYSEWVENLPLGNYYWEEVTAPEGYLKSEELINFSITYNGEKSDKAAESESVAFEKEKYNRARVIKMDTDGSDSSEKEIAVGAIIRLYLVSDPTQYYDATIQEDGSAEFIDQEYKKENPDEEYTIPYGVYNIKEIQGSEKDQNIHTQFYIQEYTLELTDNHRTETVIVSDEAITPYIKVIKTDSDTGYPVEIAGAKFKIWDCQKNEFVKQFYTPKGEWIDEFETNSNGYFITPTYVQPGKYIIYETESPRGYVLNEKWRLPEEEYWGVEGKGGKVIDLNKITIGVKENEEYDQDVDVIYPVEMDDEEYKGKVEVHKLGEMITGVDQTSKDAFDETYDVQQPKYEYKGLEGVEYTLTVKENIMSPDGKHVKVAQGTKYKIKTGEDGYGTSEVLYCGTYTVEETKTPDGYLKDNNIPDIEVINDQTEPIQTTNKEYQDKKIPTEFYVEKSLENTKYKVDDEKIKVVIGLYSKNDILNYNQSKTVIRKDTLLDVLSAEVTPGEKEELVSKVNLPEGDYYFKEIYVDYPYTLDETNYDVNVRFDSTIEDVLKIRGVSIENMPKTVGSFSIFKLSVSSLYSAKDDPIVGGILSKEEINELTSPVLEWMKKTPVDEVKAVLTGKKESEDPVINQYKFSDYLLSNAEYAIYVDEACTKPLLYTETNKPVTITTDNVGYGRIEELPIGEYWLKEITPPKYIYKGNEIVYDLDPNPTYIIIDTLETNSMVCRALWDDIPYGKIVTKKDLFTGESIPDCVFKVEDKDGNEIIRATTDKNGNFEMKLDWFKEGETYTYTEIEAPDIYNIDTTPHEFTIEFDENGEIIKSEAENTRKTRKVIVRKLDADTGDPLEGCVFTIALIDEETGEQKVNAKTGEPIYLVENVTTDENGEYVIDDAPMGTYKFTEIKAPEGYELDEDLTGLVFTIDNDSPETIIFEVTNTGDIAVIAISILSIVCVAGVAFVVIRNKKQQNA